MKTEGVVMTLSEASLASVRRDIDRAIGALRRGDVAQAVVHLEQAERRGRNAVKLMAFEGLVAGEALEEALEMARGA